MFTGIVEELGTLRASVPNATGAHLEIACQTVLEDAHVGDSIAVNGCCLTVVSLTPDSYIVDAVEETLRMTSLGRVQPGERVNLERSVRLADRLGGHLMQGHVDGVGTLQARATQADDSVTMTFAAPSHILRYVVYKGSIAIDGISLTVAGLSPDTFDIAVIPYTQAVTTLGFREIGAQVNLEVDILAKYVERLLDSRLQGSVE